MAVKSHTHYIGYHIAERNIMKSFNEWLSYIKESYNKDILNNLLKRLEQESHLQSKFIFEKEEVREIENVTRMAKQKWLGLMNAKYAKEFKQYLDWEKKTDGTLVTVGEPNVNRKKLSPPIKIGQVFDFGNLLNCTVNQEFYNLLIWRDVINGLGELVVGKDPHKYIQPANNSPHNVLTGLKRLGPFIT
jgi:hypothetical protein